VQLSYKVISQETNLCAGIVPVQLNTANGDEKKNQRKKKADLYLVVALEPDRSFVYYLCRFRENYSESQMINLVINIMVLGGASKRHTDT
jgi:hypothetical protein